MDSTTLREKFLEHFRSRGHAVHASSSLVPDDPTLFLTAAGMVQFKPYFLGQLAPRESRLTTVQKCIRTTDIENVGHTARHLTFFEMLGNFSIGDYYKEEAIAWAWELLVDELGMDKEKLSVTVFREDDEAADIWEKEIGVPAARIFRMDEADNFWDAGPTGPCGPCSELMYDLGPEAGCGRPGCAVGCDCDRYLEVWNLVFMQYDRQEDGSLQPLPKKNIDTGMGLERLASVLQGARTNFETDLLKPLIDLAAGAAGASYGAERKTDTSLRIIADHVRATSFLISDGVFPSNEGRGYILRRLIRRAVMHARRIGIADAFLAEASVRLIGMMRASYPELSDSEAFVARVLGVEEERFDRTLDQGVEMLNKLMDAAGPGGTVPGKDIFTLHDTYGFPFELTRELLEENGLKTDETGFEEAMGIQRDRARAAREAEGISLAVASMPELERSTEFVGYRKLETESTVVAVLLEGRKSASAGEEASLLIDPNPFYGESGGQLGDAGRLHWDGGSFLVSDTRRDPFGNGLLVGTVETGTLKAGDRVSAKVDAARRLDISRNHTATHLLHWALRLVLGEHVKQAGSLVGPERLRFDFSHFAPLSDEEKQRVEELVNRRILENEPVLAFSTTMDSAREAGAMAIFGEKYGDVVRLVELGDFSKELCGGTHLRSLAETGPFRIVSESSVGANLRRIEAVTGRYAYASLIGEARELESLAAAAETPAEELPSRLMGLLEAEGRLQRLEKDEAGERRREEALRIMKEAGAEPVIQAVVTADSPDELRELYDRLRAGDARPIVLGTVLSGRGTVLVGLTDEQVGKGLKAGTVAKEAAAAFGGGGGGKADMAQAGGISEDDLPAAVAEAARLCAEGG